MMADAQYSPLRPGITAANTSNQPVDHTQQPTESLLNDSKKAVEAPRGWPTSARPIQHPISIAISNFIFDIFLLVCALAFLTFALTVNRYDQALTAENPRATQRLQSAIKYGPTVFPILFASIVGRAAHAVLLWRLEKGERVGILDILATSTSLTSTVTSQFQLRVVSILGLVLVTIWALSPIGGQASIRQMSIGLKNQSQIAAFDYMVNNGDISAYQFSDRASPLEIANTLFLGALIGSTATKTGPRDNWGNVKIPKIEHYEQKSTADAEGWFETKEGDISSFSSLIGIPIDGINHTNFIDYQMNVQTPYMNLDCVFPELVGNKSANWTEYLYANVGADAISANGTGAYLYYPQVGKLPARWLSDPESLAPLNFTYWPFHSGGTITRCSITSSYVEAQVSCSIASNCTVSRVRRSRLEHLPSAWTFFDIYWQYLGAFMQAFMDTARGKPSNPSLLDRYIADPLLEVTNNNTFSVPPTGESDSSNRLGQLINTYFTALGGLYAISGGISNESAFYWDRKQSFIAAPIPLPAGLNDSSPRQHFNWTGDNRKARMWSAEGTKTVSSEIIVAHKGWVAALSIASVLLIVASLVSPCVRIFLIKGPEVMMNISSLASRNNPYIPLPGNGTYLDASDRARLLKGLRVRFGDVQSAGDQAGNDIGHLAIGWLENTQTESIARVRKGRWYE